MIRRIVFNLIETNLLVQNKHPEKMYESEILTPIESN